MFKKLSVLASAATVSLGIHYAQAASLPWPDKFVPLSKPELQECFVDAMKKFYPGVRGEYTPFKLGEPAKFTMEAHQKMGKGNPLHTMDYIVIEQRAYYMPGDPTNDKFQIRIEHYASGIPVPPMEWMNKEALHRYTSYRNMTDSTTRTSSQVRSKRQLEVEARHRDIISGIDVCTDKFNKPAPKPQ